MARRMTDDTVADDDDGGAAPLNRTEFLKHLEVYKGNKAAVDSANAKLRSDLNLAKAAGIDIDEMRALTRRLKAAEKDREARFRTRIQYDEWLELVPKGTQFKLFGDDAKSGTAAASGTVATPAPAAAPETAPRARGRKAKAAAIPPVATADGAADGAGDGASVAGGEAAGYAAPNGKASNGKGGALRPGDLQEAYHKGHAAGMDGKLLTASNPYEPGPRHEEFKRGFGKGQEEAARKQGGTATPPLSDKGKTRRGAAASAEVH